VQTASTATQALIFHSVSVGDEVHIHQPSVDMSLTRLLRSQLKGGVHAGSPMAAQAQGVRPDVPREYCIRSLSCSLSPGSGQGKPEPVGHNLPQRPLRVFMVAGEHSGDELGSALMGSLNELCPYGVTFSGIGGPLMASAGLTTSLVPMHSLAVMGFAELLPRLWHIRGALQTAVAAATTAPWPDAVITVDYKGFSFRLLRQIQTRARQAGQPAPAMIHYVAPSVWAFKNPDRQIQSLASLKLDAMLCILPFEPAMWRKGGVNAHYVGHPVLESHVLRRAPSQEPAPTHEAEGSAPSCSESGSLPAGGQDSVICLLPGSRKQEVERHLPLFQSTVEILAKRLPRLSCVLLAVPDLAEAVRHTVSNWDVKTTVLCSSMKEEAFGQSTVALACSGSITAQLAASRLPSVVTYRANWLTEWIVRQRVTLKHASLPNIVLGREVVPEALFSAASPERLADLLHRIVLEQSERSKQIRGLDEFIDLLHSSQPQRRWRPSQVAAALVMAEVSEKRKAKSRGGQPGIQ